MKSPYREFEKSTEYDKVNLGATPTPKTAKEDISLPSPLAVFPTSDTAGLIKS
jgi:hypothetical protein